MPQFKVCTEPALDRLCSKSFEADSGCYIWTGALDSGGYGHISINGKLIKTHRVAWIEYNGAIPNGIMVLHKCDTPACWNPEHLFLGTQQDNMNDMISKGRKPDSNGTRNANAKLNESEIAQILTLLETNLLTQKEIADRFGVAQTTISYINRNGWPKLKEELNARI